MGEDPLNEPRWPAQEGKSPPGFYEAWFVVASDPRARIGVWLRYAIDISTEGKLVPSVWGAFFDGARRSRTFSLCSQSDAAAIRRAEDAHVRIGSAELTSLGCAGEVEAGGHSLRWRLQFGEAGAGLEVAPPFLRPVAKLKRSGYVLARPHLHLSGALEVDGEPLELRSVRGLQAHLWGARRYPAWAWAHCSGFDEAPDTSLDLLSVQGPGGVFFPLFSFQFQGKLHRFAELPWIALSRSKRAPPAWHFSAEDATVAIDGVIRADVADMVEVEYTDPDGAKLYCSNTEIAHAELRVRTRSFPGAPWRPEGTLRSDGGAGLEFCGPERDSRVTKKMVSTPHREAPITESQISQNQRNP